MNAELAEIAANPTGDFNPYGRGNTGNSPIIALGEAWGSHMEHFLADQRYGLNSSEAVAQGIGYRNNIPLGGLSSHINLLEDFDPINRRGADPFWWIPQGLMWDLMDVRNELRITGGPIDDNVTGYTVQPFNNALQNDIRSPQQYRDRLLQQNGFDQAVINLFEQYGY